MSQFFIESESVELLREDYLEEIVSGRVEVNAEVGQAIALGGDCELIFIHPQTAEWLPLSGVVTDMQRKMAATQVEVRLASTGPKRREVLEAFLNAPLTSTLPLSDSLGRNHEVTSEEPLDLELMHSPESSEESSLRQAHLSSKTSPMIAEASQPEAPSPPVDVSKPAGVPPEPGQVKDKGQSGRYAQNIHQRVRKLSAAEREKTARSGAQAERVALERAYGSTLWEAILANPQVTGPEVAKIAKNRTAPAPTLQIIVGNRNWLNRPEIKRALLSNTRLQAAQIDHVLRTFNRSELKQVQKQTAYPQRVRQAVTKLLSSLEK